jgi:LacI family transcriptional regulator
MSDCKRVLVALTTRDFNQSERLKGIQAYLLTHPNLHVHFCLLTIGAPANLALVRKTVARFHPHGVLAHVFWKRSELPLDADVPLVNVGDVQPAYPTVMIDQVGMGRMAAEHLLAQHVEHYAFAAVSNRDYFTILRGRGFRQRLRQAGYPCHNFLDFAPFDHDKIPTDEKMCAWLTQLPKPIGIHAFTMDVAMRVLWACQEQELDIPKDVAVLAGLDKSALATAWTPTVSAIALDSSRQGYEGMRLLDRLMQGANPPSGPLLVPPIGIVQRQSSDVHGLRDPEVARMRQLIREQAHRPLAVKELLTHTPLSRSALERRFERHLAHSLHDEIVLAHMERAQRLLRETLLPVTKVAALSGYANYAVFSGAFRKHTGGRALEYRQQGVASKEP